MSDQKLIDRYEPLESILTAYRRWGDSSKLIRHIYTYIRGNLRVKKQDRKYLFDCMFEQQQHREKKIRSFIALQASELSIEEQQNLVDQLITQIKTRINLSQDEDWRFRKSSDLNIRLYKQTNIIKAFKENTKDFVELFELWRSQSLEY
jgi:hypothetical protein